MDRVVGNKVYQGMSLGKAVVTAESKAVRSLFNDREDVLFTKPSDSSDLAEKIGQLYKKSKSFSEHK
ncbi:hypothetical protein IPH70_02265 [Candidatus Roizmanbacteria bacterium]|nr:MAG: hypothetical protein IPH70_02265 [Candidatus Roizmanbacteria bacterium]